MAVTPELLRAIEGHLHGVIRGRLAGQLPVPRKLPRLGEPLPTESEPGWFPVSGMYGGFKFWMAEDATEGPRLICESWSRVSDDSWQRHVITPEGAELIEDGLA